MSTKKSCRIQYFPISFFSIILGLSGFTIASQKFEYLFLSHAYLSLFSLFFTVSIFTLFIFLYFYKLLKFQNDVKAEFNNPIKISFFPTFSISLLLISIAFLEISVITSKAFWIIGTITQLFFTLKIISTWMQQLKFQIDHMNPAWFIPAVGNILIPIAGTIHAPVDISWFFYSIGLIFWIILLVTFFHRIIFYSPLPQKLLPTLFILIAPPAVGFISYVKLAGVMYVMIVLFTLWY